METFVWIVVGSGLSPDPSCSLAGGMDDGAADVTLPSERSDTARPGWNLNFLCSGYRQSRELTWPEQMQELEPSELPLL